jgi:hypothetical protein
MKSASELAHSKGFDVALKNWEWARKFWGAAACRRFGIRKLACSTLAIGRDGPTEKLKAKNHIH